MTITLTSEVEQLINEKVQNGAYPSANEVIMASLRLLKAQEKGWEALRYEIMQGVQDIQAGRFITCQTDNDLEDLSQELIRQAQAEQNSLGT